MFGVSVKDNSSSSKKTGKRITPDVWMKVEKDYRDSALSIAKISTKYGVSTAAIGRRRREMGWPVRRRVGGKKNQQRATQTQGPDQEVVERAWRILERQLYQTELYLAAEGETQPSVSAADREKDARTLEKLVELKNLGALEAQDHNDQQEEQTVDDIRAELQCRLDKLLECDEAQDVPREPQSRGDDDAAQ